jgi:hypothetical protein
MFIPGTIRHSLQDKLSKAIQMSSSGRGRPEEIRLKLCSSTGDMLIFSTSMLEPI